MAELRLSLSWRTLLLLVVVGCGDSPLHPRIPEPVPGLSGDVFTDIAIPTYDHSGQTVHPDFARAPEWWTGEGPSLLALTPYPNGDATRENPSLFHGALDQWALPLDAPNPVRLPTSGYLSDPDIVFDPDSRELFLYFRQVSGGNRIRLMRTTDGVHWTDPVTVIERPEHEVVSPAVVRRAAGSWMMWSINSGASGCNASSTTVELRTSTDGEHWGEPRTVDLPRPPSGLMPWHIDVQWIPSREEYWAIFNAKDELNCGTTAIYAATSADGVSWRTLATPVLRAGQIDELHDIVYRTTFDYDAASDQITFWYSGAKQTKGALVWKTVAHRLSRGDVFDRRFADALPAQVAPSVVLRDPP